MLLDCAHGATFRVAPETFRRLGARVSVLGDDPDGRNINAGCGSTHIEQLAARVLEGGHAVGFAFDGDGDRVLAVDRAGRVVDGDELIALVALHLRATGRLLGNGVAVTVMTNYGFHRAMDEAGIVVATTAVGDRYVLEELRARNWVLGGEQSGHLIEMGFNRSGDGIATALLVLEALGGRDLCERDAMQKLPQTLVNVRVRDRESYAQAAEVLEAVRAAGEALRGRGRVLVRPSGTEPLVRVMVEAPDASRRQGTSARGSSSSSNGSSGPPSERPSPGRTWRPACAAHGAARSADMFLRCAASSDTSAAVRRRRSFWTACAGSNTAAMTARGSRSWSGTGSSRCGRSGTWTRSRPSSTIRGVGSAGRGTPGPGTEIR